MVWVSFSLQIYSTLEFWRFKCSVVWVLVWVSSFYGDGGGSRTVKKRSDFSAIAIFLGLGGENPAVFPKARPIFQQPFSLPESAQTLAGIAFRAAGKSVRNFPAASKFARKLFQLGRQAKETGTAQGKMATKTTWDAPDAKHCRWRCWKARGGHCSNDKHVKAERSGRQSQAWWTFQIFFIFSFRGRGRGSPWRGGRFSIEKSQEGGGVLHEMGGGQGPGGCLRGNFGGELNIFFRGRNAHQAGVLGTLLQARSANAGNLGGRFGDFLFFSARGRGRGSPRRQEGVEVDFLWKIPGGEGSPGRVGPGGGEGVCGDFGGGGG